MTNQTKIDDYTRFLSEITLLVNQHIAELQANGTKKHKRQALLENIYYYYCRKREILSDSDTEKIEDDGMGIAIASYPYQMLNQSNKSSTVPEQNQAIDPVDDYSDLTGDLPSEDESFQLDTEDCVYASTASAATNTNKSKHCQYIESDDDVSDAFFKVIESRPTTKRNQIDIHDSDSE